MIRFIKVFLKSWKYYPELIIHLRKEYGVEHDLSRFQYCIFMMKQHKLQIEANKRFLQEAEENRNKGITEWKFKSLYNQKPIERGGE